MLSFWGRSPYASSDRRGPTPSGDRLGICCCRGSDLFARMPSGGYSVITRRAPARYLVKNLWSRCIGGFVRGKRACEEDGWLLAQARASTYTSFLPPSSHQERTFSLRKMFSFCTRDGGSLIVSILGASPSMIHFMRRAYSGRHTYHHVFRRAYQFRVWKAYDTEFSQCPPTHLSYSQISGGQ